MIWLLTEGKGELKVGNPQFELELRTRNCFLCWSIVLEHCNAIIEMSISEHRQSTFLQAPVNWEHSLPALHVKVGENLPAQNLQSQSNNNFSNMQNSKAKEYETTGEKITNMNQPL